MVISTSFLKKISRKQTKYFLILLASLILFDILVFLRFHDINTSVRCNFDNDDKSKSDGPVQKKKINAKADEEDTNKKQENKNNQPWLRPLSEHKIDSELIKYLCSPAGLPTVQYGCQDIESLKQSEALTLQTGNDKMEETRGNLRIDENKVVKVTLLELEESTDFVRNKDTLARLLRWQHWSGTPRVYGACLLSPRQMDVCRDKEPVKFVSYIVQRFDEDVSVCKSPAYDEDCANLITFQKHLKSQPDRRKSTLLVLRNLASVFRGFYENGIIPFKLTLNQIVVTKEFDVKLTSVDDFYNLQQQSEGLTVTKTYSRFFGDIPCSLSPFCQSNHLVRNEKIYHHLGKECWEIAGLCDPYTSRCYGVDAQTYVCLFSKWILQTLITSITKDRGAGGRLGEGDINSPLEALLICTQQPNPKTRCSWRAIETTLNRVLKKL